MVRWHRNPEEETAMTRPDEDLAPGDHLEPDERDIEAPTADAAEQAVAVGPVPGDRGDWREGEPSRGLEVGEWDAVEQSVIVDLDDEYDR
jgi:hypothetical protein